MKLSKKSQIKLLGTHPQLNVFVFLLMQKMNERKKQNLNYTDFGVFEGLRTLERQKYLIKNKKSKTLHSLHLQGLAVDIVVYIPKVGFTWDDRKYSNEWEILLKVAEQVIEENQLQIDSGYRLWGWDKAHFQLSNLRKNFNSLKYLSTFFKLDLKKYLL